MADTKKGKPDKAKNETVKRESADLLPSLMREVEDKIAVIRNQEVIADADVAALYGVETKRINEAVRNNPDKFPEAYMFTLIDSEFAICGRKFRPQPMPNRMPSSLLE